MRKSLFALILLAAIAAAPMAMAECCSCSAPDSSCNASVCCAGGCSAICGSGGRCSASCSGGGGKPTPAQRPELRAPGEDDAAARTPDPLSERVTLQLVDISAEEVSTIISNLAQREIAFVPSIAGERFSIQATDFKVGELISALAEHGAVGSVPRHVAFSDIGIEDTVSLEAKGVSGATLAEMVRTLTNGRAELVPVQPDGILNLEVKNLRLGEFLRQLALFGSVTLDGQKIADE